MSGCSQIDDPFFCPTKWQLFEQVCAVLRPGRATQTHLDTVEIAADVEEVWPPDNPWGATLTVMQQYWASFAEVLEVLHQRACALIEEMFCSSATETRREWEVEYGFPDACEHYDDLCEKVNAIGGATCAYLVAAAARRGWSITCIDCNALPITGALRCGWLLGDGHQLGCGRNACDENAIYIYIDAANSPALVLRTPPMTGCGWQLGDGRRLGCTASLEALSCLIDRIKPAHMKAVYLAL